MNLRRIAEGTVAALERGNYIAPSGRVIDFKPQLDRCVEGTQCYRPEALVIIREEVLARAQTGDPTEW
jgi:hypothetical protein